MKAQLSWLVGYCLKSTERELLLSLLAKIKCKSMEKLDISLISPSSLWFLIGTQMVLICKMFLKKHFQGLPWWSSG